MKILYVEDNTTDVDLTKRAIKKAFPNYLLHNVRTIDEAEKELQKEKAYDLLLLDLNLPDGNGMDLLVSIRKKNSLIPVIILTGTNNEEIAITALKAGADDYLSKSNGYLKKLPNIIGQGFINFQKKQKFQSKTINVLYVEWYEADIEFTKRHFNKFAPYLQVKAAISANEALNLLPKSSEEESKFDILLLDYHLPGINAIELIKIIRQERNLSIPIVVVTGQGNEEIAVQALKLGIDDYLVKRENYLTRLPSVLLSVYQKYQLEIKQKELQKSKEEYQSFFDDDLTGDFISTIDGKLLNCNPAYLKIFGFSSKEEALNFDVRTLYANSEKRRTIIQRLKKGEKAISYDAKLKRPDGKEVQVIGNMVGGYDKNGNLITLKGYILDDTEKKLAVDKLRKLSQALEQSPATKIITDLNGNIEYVNKKFTEVTGYLPKEVLGKNPRIFNAGVQDKEFYQSLWETITSGKDWYGEMLNLKKDNSQYWEKVSISSIKDEVGKRTHFLAVKEDITEKKISELKLRNALAMAQESDRLKSAFLANMSHEIRTPMNGILGFSELLKSPNLSNSQQQKYIEVIEKSGARLLSTINDIVDISKIESGLMKIVLSETNIKMELEELYSFFESEAQNKGIKLMLVNSIPYSKAFVKTDRDKIYAILLNLIKNAIKFTKQGYVEFGCAFKENNLEFYVKDTGIGIPLDRQPYVFDRFVQGDIEDKAVYEGSGLGLAITKSYVEMLGGSIELESSEGVGSTFRFTIPYEIIDDKKLNVYNGTSKKNDVLEIPMLKILVVEDDIAAQLYIKELLTNVSKEIIIADNGYEALDLFHQNSNIDLILMDIRIPGINGYEVTRQIREFNKEVIIIAQTAFALSGDREKALDVGCNDYFSKPLKKEDLFVKINAYFKK